MTFVYFMIFGVVLSLSTILCGGSLQGFIDLPSVISVGASLLLFVLAGGKWKVFSSGMKHFFAWRQPAQVDRNSAAQISRFFRTLSFASLAIGGFWSVFGLIIMLANLDPKTLGIGLGVALLSLFYSFMLSLTVFFPISLYFSGMHDARKRKRPAVRMHDELKRQE